MTPELSFTKMDEADAREILLWRYEAPYDFCNPEVDNIEADIATLIEPTNNYYAIRDRENSLIGYYCFGNDARVKGGNYDQNAVDIGCSAKPELLGTGFGGAFISVATDLAQRLLMAQKVRATVANFNARAIRMCEKDGFIKTQEFTRDDGVKFVVLTKEIQADK